MKDPQLSIQTSLNLLDLYSDSRTHGYQGPTRNVRLYRAAPSGGSALAKNEDGLRCAVTGKESLKIIRVSDGSQSQGPGHKSSVGRGGHRIDSSRNFWDGSGLKIDSASTDVAWGCGVFNNKILTSARNGELIMWDLNQSGVTKYERRSKDHIRSIHKMSVSQIVQHYCITGSADGDMRVWDLRDLSKSLMRVHHPTSVRSVVFSPSTWQPLHAVVGLDSGSIYRWDLKMGQRGLLDRLPVAHTASVTALDWCNLSVNKPNQTTSPSGGGIVDGPGNGLGWLVSGGLDRRVKVWDLTAPGMNTHIPHKATYTLHPSFPVRRVAWRPSYECELAVVSNAEFATGSNPDFAQNIAVDPGMLTNNDGDLGTVQVERDKREIEGKAPVVASGIGDAVEIWDVRRGFIAKWSVIGSAVEGGVVDLTFHDSDAIWTQHSSGMFSQIDLRNCTKPMDAITQTAITWEASGSLAFVTSRQAGWQIPYDDIAPGHRQATDKRFPKLKALGDKRYVANSQDMGTLMSNLSVDELDVFTKLAQEYILEGENRPAICRRNAELALHAGKEQVAQVWLLLGASLTDLVPNVPSAPPHATSLSITHSVSAPATMANTSYTFPSAVSTPSRNSKVSPGRGSTHSTDIRVPQRSASTSTSRKKTPVSSNSSSPRHTPNALPTITPRRPSMLGSRDYQDLELSRHSSLSFYRRPSISTPSIHSTSPGERGSSSSLRHVGEGALDDSDSSSGSGGDYAAGKAWSDEESSHRPLISPTVPPTRTVPAPSPLSRVAGKQWTEDEHDEKDNDSDDEEASSPSPRSTDTDSTGSSSPRRRPKSNGKTSRRNSKRLKSHSRSSTVASLAAPPPPATRPLVHQHSYNSIRTVTAGEVSFRDNEGGAVGVKAEDTVLDVRTSHNRRKAHALSEFALGSPAGNKEETDDVARPANRRVEIVRSEEKKFRDMGWDALREALELFADEGDIQMCAMLSVIAPEELRIPKRRANRFLESYIEVLTRRRLHTCSAYLRRCCGAEDVRATTLLETTIYTTCGKCRKPLVVPAGSQAAGQLVKGGYSFCLACKSSCVTCAICRLPVHALLLQCSVCCHGGHQACYRRYFMQRPMVDLPGTSQLTVNISDRTLKRTSSSSSTDEDTSSAISVLSSTFDSSAENSPVLSSRQLRLAGHPCAAGCGHFCWATNAHPEEM